MAPAEAKLFPALPADVDGPEPFPRDGLQPFCAGCQVFIRYDDVLAALVSTGEMRMFHYLCPHGVREVVFRIGLST